MIHGGRKTFGVSTKFMIDEFIIDVWIHVPEELYRISFRFVFVCLISIDGKE